MEELKRPKHKRVYVSKGRETDQVKFATLRAVLKNVLGFLKRDM